MIHFPIIIISEILLTLAEEMNSVTNSERRSTEEVIAGIEDANSKPRRETVIFSSDVKALYPSLRVEEVSRIEAKECQRSELEIEVNEELGLYLALSEDQGRVRELGLEDVICKWKKEGGRGKRPGITTAEVLGGRIVKQKSLFELPKNKPTAQQRKIIVSLALEIGIEMVIWNHLYQFDVHHLFFTCPKYDEIRNSLQNSLPSSLSANVDIFSAVHIYIKDSLRFN